MRLIEKINRRTSNGNRTGGNEVIIMVKSSVLVMGLVIGSILTSFGCTSDTPADEDAAAFYENKSLEVTTTGSIGSEDDLLARLIATRLRAQTGSGVVVNNRRGAGGMEGMNYVYSAKRDGLTLGVTASAPFVSNKVLDEPVAVYDISEFSYIMSVGRQPVYFFVSPDGPYQSVDDIKAGKNLKIM